MRLFPHPFPRLSRVWARTFVPVLTVLVWALAAFSAVTWGLRWSAAGGHNSTDILATAAPPEFDLTAAARSLGAGPVAEVAPASLSSRFQLQGVLAGNSAQSTALIAVDGRPPKPFRVGSVVSDGVVLQSTEARRANLAAAQGQALALDLPPKK